MFAQTFKNLDNVLRLEDGCTSELDYTEQSSWMLFLKYLDDLEKSRSMEAELEGEEYRFILSPEYRWSSWAKPLNNNGEMDDDRALIGDDLIEFVNKKLFPYLAKFKESSQDKPDTIEYKIGEIFDEVGNRFRSGYSLRDAIDLVDQLKFRSQVEKHEMSALYEEKIKNMGNAGRSGGEYYTPRALIRAMIEVMSPTIGETIYDAACGSAGFLCESHDYLLSKYKGKMSSAQLETLQKRTFYGKEKKPLPYVIAIMNMILHGIDAPNIIRANTLSENVMNIQEKDKYDIILANPPFGSGERPEVQQNFPIRSGETAYLFMQHFIKRLRTGGRAAVVIKNTVLSNGDATSLRKMLLQDCNLHTILDCPAKTFQGAGVKTVVLFFEKGKPTKNVWYYQLNPGRSLGKTNPLNDNDLEEFVKLQKTFADSEKSWSINVADVNQETFDLSVKNPNEPEEEPLRAPEEIIAEITALDAETAKILKSIQEVL